ncbi:MAG: microcin ABC transporter ATP-binding protein [Pseudomonadales bacterium]|jgi:microcin C transport system ATP-binding protein|uniref:ABC transporter ATP-binding protein n=1 Tax=unclassified Ketobacter TaxID=2639109 RepID=UPI000C48C400|nr:MULTISPECIES: ABC transporter ATP-binding protein [unclassified Ketobacter]MAQ26741.1 microcin ABC transporter ATP-binding protein [Pseudomonadales bacterium]MEC8809990.1 ABC transporter ATP-binding protein [Pseudomonadota bacterium]TNC88797.1 MAG: microcin ABC transporter ATP-binding protein [Alcanivorax sp.]HAG96077.1 microcin ABC transporter ATP-binding protein [Gammaproteobacteria bacterium]MBI28167.1 microcin ABC transporter ATP-binding protein [Pseudomonadales bacterium]|tara:strand:+ start:10447 stop:12045 length:1599 start_codon:yes stop_codon:yes gene_type:complete
MTSDTILSVQSLSVAFRQGEQSNLAVDNVSFDLKKGETFALVGESGSGKSVTAMAITKLLPESITEYSSGSVIFENENLLDKSESQLRQIRGNRIGMIFQEPLTALNPLHTVQKQIGEILRIHRGLNGKPATTRIIELLGLVGIPDPASRLGAYPHQLSGGQRQRVMIAMALANEPDILIADEPTTALDVTIQKQVLLLLQELQQKLGMTVLLITHDLGVVRRYAHRVGVMTRGKLVEVADSEVLFTNPQHAYTRALLDAEPKGLPVNARQDVTAIMKVDSLRVWFPVKKGVFKHTVGYIKAVDDISFTIKRGHTLGIVGESGSGKTTLVQALLKLTGSSGSILFNDQDLQPLNSTEVRPLRKKMQIVFQDPFSSLSPRMSIEEIVAEGLVIHDIGTAAERADRVKQALAEVGLDPEMRHRFPHEFSGGQRQRIAVARALILDPELIVLDEPTSALDRSIQAQLMDLLRSLQDKHGFSYIFISHDLKVVKTIAHDVLVLKEGKALEYGPAKSVFEAPQHPYTVELLESAFAI